MAADGKRSMWRSNLGVIMISSGLWRIGGRMTWPFWPLYVLHLGGSYLQIGLISAVSSVLGLIPALLGGYLADNVGRKKMIYSMSALMALNGAIYFLAPSWEWLLIARSLDSIYGGLRHPAFNALLADSTNEETRALSYGLWQTVPPVFGFFSPYAIGVLMDRYGVLTAQRWAYLILMATSALAAFIRFKFLTETLPPNSREGGSAVAVVRDTLSDFKETARAVSRQVWILILMGGLFQFGASAGSIFMVTYATEDVIRLSAAEWGLINTASTIVSMAVSVPFAVMADRYGRQKLVMASLSLKPLAILGFTYGRGFVQALAFYVALTILGSMGSVASQALFIDYSPREHRGRINALTGIIGATQSFNFQMGGESSIIGAAGSVFGGFLYGDVSYASPLLLMAGMIGSSAAIGVISVKEPRQREE
ncbi:MAG: MFS transporter [Candidatus Bathyarchaeota archaeon]|nr:MFS transporter [Candidatus Bathyarchaeota archaeon]